MLGMFKKKKVTHGDKPVRNPETGEKIDSRDADMRFTKLTPAQEAEAAAKEGGAASSQALSDALNAKSNFSETAVQLPEGAILHLWLFTTKLGFSEEQFKRLVESLAQISAETRAVTNGQSGDAVSHRQPQGRSSALPAF
tara:strand:+ start:459 stop:878 length:420 start_codon:yes stop_codon:yes gene_type:complete